MAMIITTKLKV